MTRREIVLAGLAGGDGATYTPVQVQKLFFLIDRNISALVRGPHFDFQPYNYGPFDKTLYHCLEELSNDGLVVVASHGSWNTYNLSVEGQQLGNAILNSLVTEAADYIRRVSAFVRSLSFTQLVSAIYKAYPEMRENSVFQK
jgi:uncharacterized protein